MTNTHELLYNINCVFCPDNNYYLYDYLFDADKMFESLILFRSNNFIVIPDIAPLVEGYLLIIPTIHYTCFGSMPYKIFEEFETVKTIVEELLTKAYARPIFFEHGAAKPKQGGCCVDHAHFHCIPTSTEISTLISSTLTSQPIDELFNLLEYGKNDVSYLYYENRTGKKVCYPLYGDSCYIPSQYLRMLLAASINQNVWDWREMVVAEESRETCQGRIMGTINKLRPKLSKYRDNYNYRGL